MSLPTHDLEALLAQGVTKELRATQLLAAGKRHGVWHLVDAAEAFERCGRPEDAARCRATFETLAGPFPAPAKEEPAEEAPAKPKPKRKGAKGAR